MTKAMLSRRGVEFDAFDVENDPEAMRALRALGIASVPAVVVGDRWITGWNPTRLAELVGFAHQERGGSPEEMVASLREIVDAALRAVRQIPDGGDEVWERRAPGRDRPLRELARHLFEVVERGVDADVLETFPAKEWLPTRDVPGMRGAARLARYGEAVRAKFDAWYGSPLALDAAAFGRTIDADVGPRTLAQVLQRTRLHAAQHLRQLYAFLGWFGVTPEAPLTDADLRAMGLDELPDELF